MSQVEPKCPYCGTVMILERGHERGLSYACPNCWSESPFIQYKDGGDTEALSLEAALRRQPNKPLTLEGLHSLIGPGDEVVTYCEAKGAERTYANIWTGDLVIDVVGYEHKNSVCFENYGKTWRAWATRPTDEERAAAPWEE